jgi:hypothetical protein
MHVVPSSTNDNAFARQLYHDEPECLPYIPAARYLIEKYISAYWKHDTTNLEFVHMELTLCRYVMMETSDTISRNLILKWLARVLEVNPVRLYNDPDLPF